MRATLLVPLLALALALVPSSAVGGNGACESADPSTYNTVSVAGETYYIEERGNPLGTDPPVPGSGFLLSDGTWVWKESNGQPGLQNWGGVGLLGTCFPPEPLPCLIVDEDPVDPGDCGDGDELLV